MPPSAITGTPLGRQLAAASMIAVSCGTPTPATTRVVQIEPGPDADLDRVGAGLDQGRRRVGGRDVAGDDLRAVGQPPHRGHAVEHAARMAMRGVDHDHVGAGRDQRLRPLEPGRARAGRRTDAQPALLVLAGVREALRLLDVLDRDQPDQAVGVVDHQQLLDPVLVQQLHGLGRGRRPRAR